MSKRKLPDTSIDAHNSIKGEVQENHWKKILEAFDEVESATYEEIAVKCGLDRIAVGRRISELIEGGKLYRTELKRPTSSGRQAYCISRIGVGLPKAEDKPPKVAKPKAKPVPPTENKIVVSEYVRRKRKTDEQVNKSHIKQNHLF